jgi:cold shock CspA family protein
MREIHYGEARDADGKIKKWNGDRGFGFIKLDTNGNDVFVSRLRVRESGFARA